MRVPATVISLAFLCGAALVACTERSVTDARGDGGPISFALTPEFHLLGSASQVAPINFARLTVFDADTRQVIAGPFVVPVDPNAAVFRLPVTFDLPSGAEDANVVVQVLLLNITNNVESVEWSGVTSTLHVQSGGEAPPAAQVQVFQGPPGNLAVTGVSIINKPTGTLTEGESIRLIAIAEGGTGSQIFWRSSNTAVATVDDAGLVQLLRDGVVSIVASAGPRSDGVAIAIGARAATIVISPATQRAFSFGEELQYSAIVRDARATVLANHSIAWSSDNESILQNLGNGRFVARADGNVTIRATSLAAPEITTTAAGDVRQRVFALRLDPTSVELTAIGQTQIFQAFGTDARGNNIVSPPVTWRSSNTAVFTIDAAGRVTAVARGSAAMTATSPDGPTAG
ncbi:MAG: Ig-like domain-containing protein, partial [Longimicrobiales bacterium]